MSETNHWHTKANFWYTATVIGFVALLLTFVANQVVHRFSLLTLAMQWLPLVIFIPGLIAKVHYRTYSWLCFVLLAYFTAFVVEVGSPLRIWTDIVGLVITCLLFTAAMFASRTVQRWQYHHRLDQQ